VALSTYPADPPRHGGQTRLNRLVRSLGERADVHVIALGPEHGGPRAIHPGVVQTTILPPPTYFELDRELSDAVQAPAGDIVASFTMGENSEFGATVAGAVAGCDAVLLTQPYLYPTIRALPVRRIVCDAQNAEGALKRAMYAAGPVGDALASAVCEIEAAAIRAAHLVTAVSRADQEILSRIPCRTRFAIVPNGADVFARPVVRGVDRRRRRDEFLRCLGELDAPTELSSVALFIGSAHPPNLEAAVRIIELARSTPSTFFILVGNHVDALDGIPTSPNVLARGQVEVSELEQLLGCCDVALNPVSAGSGTNVKMLDYFAAGAPTISTAVGARGLGVEAGVHYHDADVHDLPAALNWVVSIHQYADALGQAGRQHAEASDWTVVGTAFTDAVLAAIEDDRADDGTGDPGRRPAL
jgi:glycosyltransferase involved in cell wall biosynthesis